MRLYPFLLIQGFFNSFRIYRYFQLFHLDYLIYNISYYKSFSNLLHYLLQNPRGLKMQTFPLVQHQSTPSISRHLPRATNASEQPSTTVIPAKQSKQQKSRGNHDPREAEISQCSRYEGSKGDRSRKRGRSSRRYSRRSRASRVSGGSERGSRSG